MEGPGGGDWPSEDTAAAILDWLRHRPASITEAGRFSWGPLEDVITPLEVRVRGDGQDAEFEIVFEHLAFPGKRFGLRTGRLWHPVPGLDDGPWLDREDPVDNGVRIGNWAEDFPTLTGLPGDQPPDDDGVIWIATTYRDQLSC